jgi:hypothetical protein
MFLKNLRLDFLSVKRDTLRCTAKYNFLRYLALAQLLYVCSKFVVPVDFLKKVEKEIVHFLWNGKKAKLNIQLLLTVVKMGVWIDLPDFELGIKAQQT